MGYVTGLAATTITDGASSTAIAGRATLVAIAVDGGRRQRLVAARQPASQADFAEQRSTLLLPYSLTVVEESRLQRTVTTRIAVPC